MGHLRNDGAGTLRRAFLGRSGFDGLGANALIRSVAARGNRQYRRFGLDFSPRVVISVSEIRQVALRFPGRPTAGFRGTESAKERFVFDLDCFPGMAVFAIE
jgi:hypothetical protein